MAEVNAPDLRVVEEERTDSEDLVGEYLATLSGRSASTVEVYGRTLRSLAGWASQRSPTTSASSRRPGWCAKRPPRSFWATRPSRCWPAPVAAADSPARSRVLFLCNHNSARWQMTEGLLRHLTGSASRPTARARRRSASSAHSRQGQWPSSGSTSPARSQRPWTATSASLSIAR